MTPVPSIATPTHAHKAPQYDTPPPTTSRTDVRHLEPNGSEPDEVASSLIFFAGIDREDERAGGWPASWTTAMVARGQLRAERLAPVDRRGRGGPGERVRGSRAAGLAELALLARVVAETGNMVTPASSRAAPRGSTCWTPGAPRAPSSPRASLAPLPARRRHPTARRRDGGPARVPPRGDPRPVPACCAACATTTCARHRTLCAGARPPAVSAAPW